MVTKPTHTGVSQLARETGYSIASVSKKLTAGKTPNQIRDDAKRAGIKPTVLVTSTGKLASKAEIMESQQAIQAERKPLLGSATHANGHASSSSSSSSQSSPSPRSRVQDENYYQAQARKERILADLRELEYQEKVGQLAPVDLLNSWFSGCIVRARDILLNIGPELRDRLAQETDPVRCEEMVTFEIRRGLSEMSVYGTAPAQTLNSNSHSNSSKET